MDKSNSSMLIFFMNKQSVQITEPVHISKPYNYTLFHSHYRMMDQKRRIPRLQIHRSIRPSVQLLLCVVFGIHTVHRPENKAARCPQSDGL